MADWAAEICNAFSALPFIYDRKDLYVLLPPHGQPVAIYAQQCRALNLVWALANRKNDAQGLDDKNVVIIGAGMAGLTAAVAAALAGANVTILEKASTPLKLQLGCEHRFLHPRFHEWPEMRSHSASAALPFLTWSVGTAGEVASSILAQFERLKRQINTFRKKEALQLKTNVFDIKFQQNESQYRVTYKQVDAQGTVNGGKTDPAVLILAVGFGTERTIEGLSPRSYWRTDSLTQPSLASAEKKLRVLVAGDGDGGIIDVLRACLVDFDHGPFIDRVVEMISDKVLIERVKETEGPIQGQALVGARKEKAARNLDCAYDKLFNEDHRLWRYLSDHRRKDVDVTYVGRLEYPASPESYTLNRILGWLVCKMELVTYKRRFSLNRVEPVRRAEGNSTWFGYTAWLQKQNLVGNDYQPTDYWESGIWDEVIVRYGAVRPLETDFGKWWKDRLRLGGQSKILQSNQLGEVYFEVDKYFRRLRANLPSDNPAQLKASFGSKVRESKIVNKSGKKECWPLFEFRLWVAEASEETRWVEYHLHPYRNGVRRTANRGPTATEEPFSMRIFTHDDYWIDAKLSDGRRVEGKWLSAILDEHSLNECAKNACAKLIECARQMLGTEYLESKPTVSIELEGDERKFEEKLEKASRISRLRKLEDLKG